MTREQQIIARDFMGLGRSDDNSWSEAVQEEKMPNQASSADIRPSLNLFQDIDSKQSGRSKVVGSLGGHYNGAIGNLAMRRIANTNLVAGPRLTEDHIFRVGFTGANHAGTRKPWSQVGTSLVVVKEEPDDGGLRLNEADKGIRHPWNKAVVMQQAASWKSQPEDKLTGNTSRFLPGRLAQHGFQSPPALDGGNLNQGKTAFGLCGVHGNYGPKQSGSFSGNEVESPFVRHAWHLGFPITQPGFRSLGPVAPNSPGKSVDPQLTIFYAGAVNVFDNIPAEKAQAIMLFAGSSVSLPTKAANSAGTQNISSVSASLSSHPIRSSSHFATAQSPQQLSSMMSSQIGTSPVAAVISSQKSHKYGLGSTKPEPFVPDTPSTPSTLPACSSAAFRALPQARKASLARFLEKRKERVCSKMPYPTKTGGADPMLSHGERLYLAPSGPGERMQSMCRMERSLMEDVATSEMGIDEHAWSKTSDTQMHVTETDCSSISLVCS